MFGDTCRRFPIEYSLPRPGSLINKHMFRALYGFFNLIFMLILFKIFAPEVFDLAIQLLITILSFLNEAAGSLSTEGMPNTFPEGL